MNSKTILAQSLLLWLLFFALPLNAAPEAAEAKPGDLNLPFLLKNVLVNNGQIQEAVQDIEIARSQLELARSALFPKGEALILGAPMFEEKGNALHSDSNWGKWGPLVKGGIQLAEPLYSFGMIGSYRKAAEKQMDARTELADVKRNEVIASAKEMYYGYLMANDLEKLIDDLSSFLEDAVKTAEDSQKSKKKSTIKPHDVFRLKTALEDLKQKKLYAHAAKMTAEKAVAWVSGVNFTSLPAPKLVAEGYPKRSLEDYIKIAKAKRPEFRALTAGQEARTALGEAKRAQSYPVLFVGGFFSAGWTAMTDKQDSVFANDPFNGISGGVGVGLKFDLDFARHAAEAHEQAAEAMKLKATESYAAPGIELQVKKAYWELDQATQGLAVADQRRQYSKKWFVGNAMGWSIGITPAKDLMESLEGDGLAKKNYIETVYSVNMALAHLSQAVGEEVAELKYR